MFGWQKSPVERRVLNETSQSLQAFGMPPSQAQSLAADIVKRAKQTLTAADMASTMTVEGMGDKLLANLGQAPVFADIVKTLAAQGVTEADIRTWHNLSQLERKVLLDTDTLIIIAFVKTLADQSGDQEAAAKEAGVVYPIYVWDFTQYVPTTPNPSLPAELKLRVNRYRDARQSTDPSTFISELRADGTFNEHVRRRIQRGDLNY